MQQFELSEELVSQIEGLIKADNKEDVAKLVEPLHPADIAEIMNELDTKEAQFLFLLLDEEKAGDVLAEIEEDERQRFIDSFPPEVIAKRFVDNMDTDDAADLVGSMPNEQQQEVLLEHGQQAIRSYEKSQRRHRDYEPRFSIAEHRRSVALRRRFCRWTYG